MTTSDDHVTGLREAFAAAPGVLDDDCPPAASLWAATRGELAADEVRRLVDHTAGCASCAEDWRLAVAFDGESAAAGPATGTVRRFPVGRLLRTAGVAAAAALVVAVAGITLIGRPGPTVRQPVWRQGEEARIESMLAEGQALSRDHCVLSWTSGPPGTTYDLQVSTADLREVVHATGLPRSYYRVSRQALADVPGATELLWRVEGRTPDGERLPSPTFVNPLE